MSQMMNKIQEALGIFSHNSMQSHPFPPLFSHHLGIDYSSAHLALRGRECGHPSRLFRQDSWSYVRG
jgi:hypothetical protein